jgi:HK97 family phage portal protein
VPPGISQGSFERFKAQFNDNNTGRFNAGRVVFGDKDTTYTPFQMSQEDLNTLEFRRFQVADISRFFGVPLHLLNETDKSTSWGTGLSEQTLAFLIYTLDPDLGRIEAELNYKLFYGSDFYVEFDRDALMAMDPLKAAQVAQAEISTGVLLINERRRHKNRPPVANGDEPMINSTNIPLRKIFEPGAQPRQDPLQADPIAPTPEPGSNPTTTQSGEQK